MKKLIIVLLVPMIFSCHRNAPPGGAKIITVSIAPYGYFVKEIAGSDFDINVMVPAGANPHIYEPFPEQITRLRKSVAYISNGYLGFERTWLDRFYEINKLMIRKSLADGIDPIASEHDHEGEHAEGADPHYWVSPKCAAIMAISVRDLLCKLNPTQINRYTENYDILRNKIEELDKKAEMLLSGYKGSSFMIYHPNLAYLARDYNLVEVPVEFEGKEPPPSRLKYLIDLARTEKINTIFVQREYDSKNAKAIASEIGAEVIVIDPLSENWVEATTEIIENLNNSLNKSHN